MLRTIHSAEDTSIYEKVVSAIFDDDMLKTKNIQENFGKVKSVSEDTSSIIFTDGDIANRDLVVHVAVEICRQHSAKHLEIIPMRILGDFMHGKRYQYHVSETDNFLSSVSFFDVNFCIKVVI